MTDSLKPSEPFSPGAWPALRAFCAAYLHQDAGLEHGSLARAFRAFWRDAADGERRQFLEEWRRLVPGDATAADGAALRQLLATLGASWLPRRATAADALRRVVERQRVT